LDEWLGTGLAKETPVLAHLATDYFGPSSTSSKPARLSRCRRLRASWHGLRGDLPQMDCACRYHRV